MSPSFRNTFLHASGGIPAPYATAEDFPYLRTRLCPFLYNIIPLPGTVEETEAIPFGVKVQERIQHGLIFLKTLAQLQSHWNKLPTCLVLGPNRCIEFTPDGRVIDSEIAEEGYEVANYLAPWAPLERTGWWKRRSQRLLFFTAPENPVLLINVRKGGREATPEELDLFAGATPDGIPQRLTWCAICAELKGQCLDPSPQLHGVLTSVSCRCENDNRCARCFLPLYRRKLNANYYNESDGQVWHVPGSICERHRCGAPPSLSAAANSTTLGK